LKEVVDGLCEIQFEKIDDSMENAPLELKMDVKRNYQWAFMYIILSTEFDVNKQLTKEDFTDPLGLVVSIILYIYSMEPPFYAQMNTAIRDLDLTMLEKLGPLARCLYQIHITRLESRRHDSIPCGESIPGTNQLGFFNQSFLLFRGTRMKARWINDWARKVIMPFRGDGAQNIKFHGNMTATENVKTALKLATPMATFEKPVLFIISARNYRGYSGFRLNLPQFSPFHQEQEILLMDGIYIFVLKVEEYHFDRSMEIIPGFEDFNSSKYITFIHLFYHC